MRALLVIDQVLRVASQGIDRHEADMVLSLLALDWQPGADGAGRLTVTLAGDGAIAVEVECLDVAAARRDAALSGALGPCSPTTGSDGRGPRDHPPDCA